MVQLCVSHAAPDEVGVYSMGAESGLYLKYKLCISGTSHLCIGTAQKYVQLLEGTQIQTDRISCIKNGMFLMQDPDQRIFHRPILPR